MKLDIYQIEKVLNHLKTLEHGWDGYRGIPINVDVSVKCLEIIQELSKDRNIVHPSIIPSCDGGCQIEWHHNGNSLEIEINPSTEITVWHNINLYGNDETFNYNKDKIITLIDNYFIINQ